MPRDPKRIDRICKALAKKWKKVPDQRLGQFFENYIFDSGHIYEQEDFVTEEKLKVLL